ncbi:MAG: YraN family protein [Planctomycetes bacterium]|nr:YraN family protein [Planctomycetota bacterium]
MRRLALERDELAWLGECLVARAAARSGARILARRIRLAGVEVDLVVRDAREVACVEVKTSTARAPGEAVRWRPAHRVDGRRIERQRRAATALSRLLPCGKTRVRCDVVEVWIDSRGKRFRLEWHRDVERPIE